MEKIYKTLVISGGAVRGLAHLGALHLLKEKNILQGIDHYVACSIGSIVSVLTLIGYQPKELFTFCKKLDPNKLQSFQLENILIKFGADEGQIIMNILDTLILMKTGLRKPTFLQLYGCTKIRFTVAAVCINTRKESYFDHVNYPDMDVLTAIRMSISIPFVFSPVLFEGKYYIDGGALNNYPIDKFNEEGTLGIAIVDEDVETKIESFEDYLAQCFICLAEPSSRRNLEIFKDNTIHILMPVRSFFDNIDESEREKYFDKGYECAVAFFDKK